MQDDEGVGIILVLGIATFIFALIAVAIGMSQNALSMSRNRTNYEKALAAAETGVDETLGRLQRAYDQYATDFPVPSLPTAQFATPACNAAPVTSPADFFKLQGEILRRNFDSAVAYGSKNTEMFMKLAGDAVVPGNQCRLHFVIGAVTLIGQAVAVAPGE